MSELWAIAVAGAAVSAGVGIAGASGAFGKGSPPAYDPKGIASKNFTYNPGQGATDLASMLPQLQQFATQATAYQTQQREKIFPGSKQQFRQAGIDLNSYLKGEVPQDVIDFTNRTVAQRTGGTFNPWTGGGRSPQAFARSVGQLSTDYVDKGLSMTPQWQQLANNFVTPLTSVAQLALESANTRYNYDALNAGINTNAAQNQYTAQYNQQLFNQQQANNMTSSIQTGIGSVAGALASGYGGGYGAAASTAAKGLGQANNSQPSALNSGYGLYGTPYNSLSGNNYWQQPSYRTY